jgi:hypothetical protein
MNSPLSKLPTADLAALPPNDTAVLMEPYFQRLGNNPSNIAPERSAELMADIFGGRLWDLNAIQGSPAGGFQPFVARPDKHAISVSYSGLAMVWCIALYGVFMLDVVKANRETANGPAAGGWQHYKVTWTTRPNCARSTSFGQTI